MGVLGLTRWSAEEGAGRLAPTFAAQGAESGGSTETTVPKILAQGSMWPRVPAPPCRRQVAGPRTPGKRSRAGARTPGLRARRKLDSRVRARVPAPAARSRHHSRCTAPPSRRLGSAHRPRGTHLPAGTARTRGQRGAAPRVHVVGDAQHPEQREAQQHPRAPPHPRTGRPPGSCRRGGRSARQAERGAAAREDAAAGGGRRSAPGRKRRPGGEVREQRATNRRRGAGRAGAGPRIHGSGAPPTSLLWEWQVAVSEACRRIPKDLKWS